jgi:hypothetical protein
MIASLLALDLASRYAGPRHGGTPPDSLAWVNGCEALSPAAVAALTGRQRTRAGLVPVLSTASPAAAAGLTGQVDVCVTHRVGDRQLAGQIAALTGVRYVRAGPAAQSQDAAAGSPALPLGIMQSSQVTAGTLCNLPRDEFVLVAGGRVIERGRAVRPVPA